MNEKEAIEKFQIIFFLPILSMSLKGVNTDFCCVFYAFSLTRFVRAKKYEKGVLDVEDKVYINGLMTLFKYHNQSCL